MNNITDVEITHYFPAGSGSLKGKFSFTWHSAGISFSDCKYFDTPTGKRFFAFPDKAVKKNPDDKPAYFPLIKLTDRARMDALSAEIIRQLKPIADKNTMYIKDREGSHVRSPKQAQQDSFQADTSELPF